ncbi:hypothetical protein [Okeania sp.]|uniref:hypothetical protein n=1 Tax=Okeania sp. TaxID=3100323 RepID=UPI002B4B3616|nr:hypothetical protein [Okeania sp.]MEB3343454.1 hypothetical protein [Okeania sp.]
MSQLFQRCNLQIGHEKDWQDGMSCWFFTVFSKYSPWGIPKQPGLSRFNFEFQYVVHYVRNPLNAIPSILMQIDETYARGIEKQASNYIYKNVDKYLGINIEQICVNNLEKAIASYLFWNQIIVNNQPSATFKVEYCEREVLEFLKDRNLTDINKIDRSKIFDIRLKNYNNSLQKFRVSAKPKIPNRDWKNVNEYLKKELNKFCDKYGYVRIYSDNFKVINSTKIIIL